MKKIILLSASCFMVMVIKAQLYIDNATFFIQSGATVTVQGDLTSNVSIQGTGLVQLKGSSNQNVNMGGNIIPNLELDNTAGATLLTTNCTIGTSMLFTNGRFTLGSQNMIIASAATITGHNSSRFFVTNGAGTLTRQALAASFLYPVGFSSTEYNPLTIANGGTADDISVRTLQNVLVNGTSGVPVTSDFANNTWLITEAVAGGSNLNLISEWVGGDELAGFNRNKSGIARFNTGTDWDLPASNVLAAAGGGPYTRTRNGITTSMPSGTPGVFAVGDLDQVNAARLSLKVFLQGPYTAGVMGDALRVAGVVPTTQPYTAGINAFYNRAGSVYDGTAGANETVPSTAVFDVAGTNDDIVDWVFLSLQDGAVPGTRLQTRVALVQRDGDIVEYDPISLTYVPVRMPIDANGNYHLVVSHRNHLAIRTPVSQLLQDGITFSYNFTTAQAQAFQDGAIVTNAAMKDLGGGVFGLWGGDANSNGAANYGAFGSDRVFLLTSPNTPGSIIQGLGNNQAATPGSAYSNNDMNMNGTINYGAFGSDRVFLLTNVLNNNQSITISKHN